MTKAIHKKRYREIEAINRAEEFYLAKDGLSELNWNVHPYRSPDRYAGKPIGQVWLTPAGREDKVWTNRSYQEYSTVLAAVQSLVQAPEPVPVPDAEPDAVPYGFTHIATTPDSMPESYSTLQIRGDENGWFVSGSAEGVEFDIRLGGRRVIVATRDGTGATIKTTYVEEGGDEMSGRHIIMHENPERF